MRSSLGRRAFSWWWLAMLSGLWICRLFGGWRSARSSGFGSLRCSGDRFLDLHVDYLVFGFVLLERGSDVVWNR